MIRINLLPVRETKKQARLRFQAILLGAAAGVGVLICVGIHSVVAARTADKRSQILTAQADLKALEATRKEVERYQAEEAEITRKLGVIDMLERNRFASVRMMDELSNRIPERMWLTDLSIKGSDLELAGISIDAEIVAQFLSSLEESSYFDEVELEETALGDFKGLRLNKFKVKAQFLPGGAEAKDPAAAPAPGKG